MSNENKCPVSSGPNKKTSVGAASNQDWWPTQLHLNILHQHDKKSDPMDEGFDLTTAGTELSILRDSAISILKDFKK